MCRNASLRNPGVIIMITRLRVPAELIDSRVAKRAVEPRDKGFVRRRLFGPRDHLRERILKNFFSQRTVAHMALPVL